MSVRCEAEAGLVGRDDRGVEARRDPEAGHAARRGGEKVGSRGVRRRGTEMLPERSKVYHELVPTVARSWCS